MGIPGSTAEIPQDQDPPLPIPWEFLETKPISQRIGILLSQSHGNSWKLSRDPTGSGSSSPNSMGIPGDTAEIPEDQDPPLPIPWEFLEAQPISHGIGILLSQSHGNSWRHSRDPTDRDPPLPIPWEFLEAQPISHGIGILLSQSHGNSWKHSRYPRGSGSSSPNPMGIPGSSADIPRDRDPPLPIPWEFLEAQPRSHGIGILLSQSQGNSWKHSRDPTGSGSSSPNPMGIPGSTADIPWDRDPLLPIPWEFLEAQPRSQRIGILLSQSHGNSWKHSRDPTGSGSSFPDPMGIPGDTAEIPRIGILLSRILLSQPLLPLRIPREDPRLSRASNHPLFLSPRSRIPRDKSALA
ncbi:hypothetical protein DUI87_00030 [Hirundo rustica rustica]|uniref:Uncharacterized protein n=1 Tax=Hirundo rustica rustica TaxID=333673 RepID=A0A3M0LC85_HIRRU|nr:hypothetical protein DUI87_00030 [Hirundo rustica rustica]